MSNPFFERPILNFPYKYPSRHWELDAERQPTQRIIESRRKADFLTPIPKPKKRKGSAAQDEMVFDEGKGLSSAQQQYDQTSIINEVRSHVDIWRSLPQAQWGVTPETARLLNHWRHHDFSGVRPFFCQVEAVETSIWLTEVAPLSKVGKRLLEHLAGANKDANPEINRLCLKLATGVLGVDENDGLIDPLRMQESSPAYGMRTFEQMILENLKAAGVQQAHKEDRIQFLSLGGWPGEFICAEGRYIGKAEGGSMKEEREMRAGIFIGPEFGTVTRPDLVDAAREAGDAGFDVLIACAFNYEAHAGEFHKLGRIPVLKARMNADLHMADDLKTTGKGNLFVIFGEPDIELLPDSSDRLRVKVNGLDVFDPSTGEVRSDSAEGIACWFIDTDYNGESFFVRHAYFLGQNDPYTSLKTTLKAEIDPEAWSTLHSDTSRPFEKPKSGRIAVKVINHLGDEVMKVFKV